MGEKASANPERTGDTRQRLLLSALHLYAQEGLHGVSLRRIAVDAGSKNSAAMHYHFDNKLGVIRALVKMIARELTLLDADLRLVSDKPGTLHEGFRQTLLPLVKLPGHQSWGTDAVHFLSRLVSEGDAEIAAMIDEVLAPFWQRLDRALAGELPGLPSSVRRLRLLFMTTNVIHGTAEAAWLNYAPLGEVSDFDEEELLDHLVDYLIGGLCAPSTQGR